MNNHKPKENGVEEALTPHTLREVVLGYLIHHCHANAAVAFEKACHRTGSNSIVDPVSINKRKSRLFSSFYLFLEFIFLFFFFPPSCSRFSS